MNRVDQIKMSTSLGVEDLLSVANAIEGLLNSAIVASGNNDIYFKSHQPLTIDVYVECKKRCRLIIEGTEE